MAKCNFCNESLDMITNDDGSRVPDDCPRCGPRGLNLKWPDDYDYDPEEDEEDSWLEDDDDSWLDDEDDAWDDYDLGEDDDDLREDDDDGE